MPAEIMKYYVRIIKYSLTLFSIVWIAKFLKNRQETERGWVGNRPEGLWVTQWVSL